MTSASLSLDSSYSLTPTVGPSNVVEGWLKKYGEDYVAHAIWPTNIPYVMQCGKVKPKELMYREAETAFNYGDFGNRITIKPPADLKHFAEVLKGLPYENAGLIIRGTEVFVSMKGEKAFLEVFDKMKGHPDFENLREYHVQVLRDELAGRPLDRIMTKFYKQLKDYEYIEESCTEKLYAARALAIQQSPLSPEIRAGKNCIYWGFGDVVVLRGNGSSITSYTHNSEAFLLDPARNNGEFFCLDLVRDDTLILARRPF